MTSEHTPGPWFYRYCNEEPHWDDWGQVRAPGGFVLCQVRDPRARDEDTLDRHRADGTDPWAANAHLIAAAPDMLEALRVAEAELEQHTSVPGVSEHVLPFVRAALVKARGEPS